MTSLHADSRDIYSVKVLLPGLQEEARSTIRRMLDEVDFGRTEPIVRINSIDSGLAEDDLKAVMQAKRLPQTIMLPNVEQPDHIDWVGPRSPCGAIFCAFVNEEVPRNQQFYGSRQGLVRARF